jgi:hypothetical protein
LHIKLKSRSYSHLPGQTRRTREQKNANPRTNLMARSRLLIRKEVPPISGRRLHQRKTYQPPSKRAERIGIGAPNTRNGPSTKNWNAMELISSQAVMVPRKSTDQVFLLDDKQVTQVGGYSLQNKNHFHVCSVFQKPFCLNIILILHNHQQRCASFVKIHICIIT